LSIRPLLCICVPLLLGSIGTSSAQDRYQIGTLTSFNINSRFSDRWSLNTRAEARQRFQSGTFQGESERQFRYVLTDVSVIVARRVGLRSRVALGYLLRAEDGALAHRFIQQYTVMQQLAALRLAHRFMGDQTFAPSEGPEFRLRYRLSTELPLQGEAVDPGEFYVKLNNEYLNSLQNSTYDLEIRVVPLLGYDATDHLRIETGLDYRVNGFVHGDTRHSFWVSLNFFVDL
jgi:hypothetical protein